MRKGRPKHKSSRERTPLAKRLIAARLAADLTQDGLAGASGVAIATIKAIETGTNTNPKHDTLLALAEACDVDVSALTGGLAAGSASGRGWLELVERYLASPEGKEAEAHVEDPLEKERGREWLRGLKFVTWPDGAPSYESLTYMLVAFRKRERRSSQGRLR